MADPEHLLASARAGRILLTFNRRDFRVLHQLWTALNAWGNLDRSHSGILTALGEIDDVLWANLVHDFVNDHPDIDNQMWEWRRQQEDWLPFGW